MISSALTNPLMEPVGGGRFWATFAAFLALAGVVIAVLALRTTDRGKLRRRILASGALGLVAMILGGFHTALSQGGYGTGNGLAGAHIAIGVSAIGLALTGYAYARSRRTIT